MEMHLSHGATDVATSSLRGRVSQHVSGTKSSDAF